jgi:outer membrane receptor for ferrienterochelin and colicin
MIALNLFRHRVKLMNNKFRHLSLSFSRLLQGGLAATLAIVLLGFSVASNAQEISTAVRGTVTGPDGTPAVGESVSITDTRTGSVRRTTTNEAGAFTIRGLPVGGPYTIQVQSSQYQDAQVTGVFTNLSAAASFDIALGAGSEAIDEIVVLASQVATQDLAVGPGTAFSLEDIQAMPSSARQIRDIVRMDPRVTVGRAGAGNGPGINCLGGSPRNNAITIDGTIANDGFGLNATSGTGGRFSFPVPYDTIASASVEFAPLDVQYSQFTGCAINVVTKPGSNEFHGSAFYLYNDDGLTGTKIEGRTVLSDPFEDKTLGFDISGPIIKDKLFFTVAYEKFDDVGTQNTGPTGGGFANEEDYIDVDTVNQIANILRTKYDRDPGYIVRSLPFESESIFLRLDWNINDQHRAELTWSDLDELNLDPDDCCGNFDGFTMSDNFEIEGIERDTTSLRLFSNWTDNFSTLLTYSYSDVIDKQGPLGGGEQQNPNPITRITVNDGGGDAIFTSGPGINRSANDLAYEVEQIKLSADYVVGDHTLTFGFERESRDIYNLYIFDATGTITFDDVAALDAGTASGININGSYTQDPLDASATFGRDVDTLYLQDEWQVNDVFTVIAGVRWDEYKSSDKPIYNPVFEQRYGFSNESSFDGLDLVQPRLGFTWDLPASKFGSTQLTAGFGIFGGGDPTVHFANSYQNFGGAIGNGNYGSGPFDSKDAPCTDADLDVFSGGASFTGLPTCVQVAAQNEALSNTASVAALDPDYDLPSNERWSLGVHHLMESGNSFMDGWEMRLDFIETKHKDAVDWVDLRLTPSGNVFPDGRLQYFEVDPLLEDCNATFNGVRQGFSNAGTFDGDCDDTGNSNQDLLMTNGVEGSTTTISFQMAKTFDFSDATTLDLGFGYAYNDSKVGNPVTSFTAGSSYENSAKININDVTLGPNYWSSKHNIVLSARFKHYWNDNNATSVGLFFSRRSGRPYSWTYEDDTVEDLFGDSDDEESILIYVPTGPSDPAYDFTTNVSDEPCDGGDDGCFTQADVDQFFAFLDSSGLSKYAGGIAPKNGFTGKWSSDLDLRISQEIGMFDGHQLQIFLDIENVLNIFSDGNNLRRYNASGDVPEALRTLQLDDGVTDVYEVENIFFENPVRTDVDDTLYRIQLGVSYRF